MVNPLVGFLRFSELWFRRHLMMTSATYSYIDYDIIVYYNVFVYQLYYLIILYLGMLKQVYIINDRYISSI